MSRYLLLIFIWMFFALPAESQTQNDTLFCYRAETPVVIDGQATETCWAKADWHNIDQVWIPYNASMKQGDFEGRFKVAWDREFLYVLVEVEDDMLSDDHSNPLEHWWDDDCLEIFIDENRSMGNHERNNNAFAYHVSLFYDAVDLDAQGKGVNYKDNIEVDMDTIGVNTYLWELAIKNYDETFNLQNPEASRVYLSHNKLMGFAIAYCDNDETTSRENFIGSMKMTAAHNNDMYKNADYFGPLLLIDSAMVSDAKSISGLNQIKVYPVPANQKLTIEISGKNVQQNELTILQLNGQAIRKEIFCDNKYAVDIENLKAGMYILQIRAGNQIFIQKFIRQ